MKSRADLADQLVLAIGPGAVGEQDHGDARIEIDPERAAAVAKMADGMRREMASGRGVRGRRIPTEGAELPWEDPGAGRKARWLLVSKRGDAIAAGLAARISPRNAAGRARWRRGPRGRRRPSAAMRSRPELRPECGDAERGVLFGGRNGGARKLRWAEACWRHAEGLEDLAACP